MKQFRTILELRLKDVPDLFNYKKKLLTGLGAKIDPKQPMFTENVNVRVEDQFGHITIEAKRIHITVERMNPEKAQTFILNILSKVMAEVQFSKIDRFGYRSMFIEPSDDTFEGMVDTYRAAFFTSGPLVDEAKDLGTPMTFEQGKYRINFMSGPMTPEQQLEFIEYKDGLNLKNGFFIDIDYGQQNLSVDLKKAKTLIDEARSVQQDLLKKFEGTIYE